jgi:zinc transport system substrate-binding protein
MSYIDVAILQVICNNIDMHHISVFVRKYPIVFLICILAVLIGAILFTLRNSKPVAKLQPLSVKIPVVTSFYPLTFFTQQIGGDLVEIHTITPSGVEPHEYEPTTTDSVAMQHASLIVLNGGHFEPWSDKVEGILDHAHTRLLISGDGLFTRTISYGAETIVDPHVWLDPLLAIKQAERIANALISILPEKQTYFTTRLQALVAQLQDLDRLYHDSLMHCERKEIITSHAAFGYVAASYGLRQFSIQGVSPEEEPSPKAIAQMISLAKQYKLTHIFFESLVSPKVADTIAHEVGAKTIAFNPLEGLTNEEQNEGKDYFSIQRENIANLKEALQCQ